MRTPHVNAPFPVILSIDLDFELSIFIGVLASYLSYYFFVEMNLNNPITWTIVEEWELNPFISNSFIKCIAAY